MVPRGQHLDPPRHSGRLSAIATTSSCGWLNIAIHRRDLPAVCRDLSSSPVASGRLLRVCCVRQRWRS